MARKLADALPSGHDAPRPPCWSSGDRCSSPLAAMHRDAFVTHKNADSTVRLTEQRVESSLDDLNLHDQT